MKFQVGDKVRLKYDQAEAAERGPCILYIAATSGSTGVVVSVEVYDAYLDNITHGQIKIRNDYAFENDRFAPTRFETVEPYSGPLNDDEVGVSCKVGAIAALRPSVLGRLSQSAP